MNLGMDLEGVVKSFEKRLKYKRSSSAQKSEEYVLETMGNYYRNVLMAKEEGKPLTWISITVPTEIFYAMDIVPFGPEQYCLQVMAQLTRQNGGYEFFSLGEAIGMPKDTCSSHLASVGMVKSGMLPEPDIIVASSTPCDSSSGFFDVLSSLCQCPTFVIDVPNRYEMEGIEYVKEELKSLIQFLEENTGKRLDQERLKMAVEQSKKADDLCLRINELRKAVPCPIGGREMMNAGFLRLSCAGLPDAVRVVEAFHEEALKRVEEGKGTLPFERHRMIWLWGYPFFDSTLIKWLEQEWEAVIVQDFLNYFPIEWLDTEDPLGFIARRILRVPIIRLCYEPFDNVAMEIPNACKEYHIDSAVFYASWSCKHSCSLQRLHQDDIRHHLDIPTLLLDGDNYDPRVSSIVQMKVKLTEYFTMLERRN